jgi:hypothetical protein
MVNDAARVEPNLLEFLLPSDS